MKKNKKHNLMLSTLAIVSVISTIEIVNIEEVKAKSLSYDDVRPPEMTLTVDNTEPTNQDVIITITAKDGILAGRPAKWYTESNIKHIKMPDGTYYINPEYDTDTPSIINHIATYTVSKNGVYIFKAEDFAGNITTRFIEITNINKEPIMEDNSDEKKATLKLLEGEFTLKTAEINDFGKVKIDTKKQTVTTSFYGDFGVIDARGTQEGWNVTVSATPFTVETFDGFVGTPHQLPVGSLALNAPTSIERIGHVNKVDGLPISKINDYTVLDNGAIALLSANQGEGMGEFKFSFDNSLSLTLDALTAKIDTVNYPERSTPYTSTVTWNLISGPQL